MKKRVLSILMTAALAVSLAGCSGGAGAAKEAGNTVEATAGTTAKHQRMGKERKWQEPEKGYVSCIPVI